MNVYSLFDKIEHNQFVHYEISNENSKLLLGFLSENLWRCFIAESQLRSREKSFSLEDFLSSILPTKGNIKAGDFAEILSYYFLIDRHSSKIALVGYKRWLNKPDNNTSAKGTDVILLSDFIEPSVTDLLISAEIKANAVSKDYNAMQEALGGVVLDYKSRLATSLLRLKKQHIKDGNTKAYKNLLRYLESPEENYGPYVKMYKAISVVDENLIGNQSVLHNKESSEITNLELICIKFKDLQILYETAYVNTIKCCENYEKSIVPVDSTI